MSKVMLIDDDVVVVDLLETLLQMEGFDVVTNPVHGNIIEVIQEEKPDVVLLDVYLNTSDNSSEPDGLNLLKKLRQQPDIYRSKVIMSSGIDFEIESKDLGADGFLHKPYMPEELIAVIKRVLA